MDSVVKDIGQPMSSADIIVATDYGSWYGILFTTVIFAGLYYAVASAINIAEVSRNWPKYRCQPSILPFASLYGYNTVENFNYCLGNIFESRTGAVTSPFASILTTMTTTFGTFLTVLNSIRGTLVNLISGIESLLRSAVQRMRTVFAQLATLVNRMRFLLGRVYGSMFAIINMALSGIRAGQNFGDTFIFSFIDTFCFPPETPIDIQGKGLIPISQVQLGDICKDGSKVTSVYRFATDGQPMVQLGSVEVSTNHFVQYKNKWIEAKDHPDAKPIAPWNGGNDRPLVCLDTNTHKIPIGGYIFSDWDECSDSDEATMKIVEDMVNPEVSSGKRPWLYQPCIDPEVKIRMRNGLLVKAKDVKLGMISSHGLIIGIAKRHVSTICKTPEGVQVTPSTLVWNPERDIWMRAGFLHTPLEILKEPMEAISFVILSSSIIELETGEMVRDMCEVLSPDTEGPTRYALNPTDE